MLHFVSFCITEHDDDDDVSCYRNMADKPASNRRSDFLVRVPYTCTISRSSRHRTSDQRIYAPAQLFRTSHLFSAPRARSDINTTHTYNVIV